MKLNGKVIWQARDSFQQKSSMHKAIAVIKYPASVVLILLEQQ